ncbi:MAG TPA: TolC family protein [Thermoanaerobaculia bacterium]|nr:TolC family protein [Thermoanaerobaculia bacterium]
MKRLHATALVVTFLLAGRTAAEQITVSEAVRRALAANPELVAAGAEARAADAAARQSGRRINPEVELSIENAGVEEAMTETTVAVGQLFELGGDRRARIDAATAAQQIVARDAELRRLEIEARVRSAHASLLAAQQQVAIARENVASADAVFGAIRERVAAGKVSPIEETRASVTASMERIELTRAEAELESARVQLASTWSGNAADLVASEQPGTAAIGSAVDGHPELRRWEAVVAQREAEAGIERARGVPDLRASAGIRTYESGDGPAAVAAIAIPLPLDRNRNAVAAALARVEAARSERDAARLRLSRDLGEAQLRRTAAQQNVERFRTEIIPAAESVHEAITEGYRLGKFGYLEVLDARRTLAQARLQLVAAQRELELARVDVERLTGGWQ